MNRFMPGIILGSLFISFLFFIFIYSKIQKFLLNKLKKRIGKTNKEKIINDILIWTKHTKNKFINNSFYYDLHGDILEIDGILITNKAIIIINTKSLLGGIKGDGKEKIWKKILNNKIFNINNPIIKNQNIINFINGISQFQTPVIFLIIFADKISFIDVLNCPPNVLITKNANLYNILDKTEDKLTVSLNQKQKKWLLTQIKQFRIKDKKEIEIYKKEKQISKYKNKVQYNEK